MKYEEYIAAIAPFEYFKSRANNCNDDKFKNKLMEAYDKGLREVGRKILIENNITPNKTIDIVCTPVSFEPISARINKNNEVILIGYSCQDHTDYKVEKEYKLNDLKNL